MYFSVVNTKGLNELRIAVKDAKNIMFGNHEEVSTVEEITSLTIFNSIEEIPYNPIFKFSEKYWKLPVISLIDGCLTVDDQKYDFLEHDNIIISCSEVFKLHWSKSEQYKI